MKEFENEKEKERKDKRNLSVNPKELMAFQKILVKSAKITFLPCWHN